MGATSVTGVSGPGSAAGRSKGSDHMSLGVEKLIGPRVAFAGSVALVGGTKTLEIPMVTGVTADYVVTATDATAAAAVRVQFSVDANSKIGTLILTGTGTDTINYAIVKVG